MGYGIDKAIERGSGSAFDGSSKSLLAIVMQEGVCAMSSTSYLPSNLPKYRATISHDDKPRRPSFNIPSKFVF
jgi:hypothetical protein